jgi:hypothetical protein
MYYCWNGVGWVDFYTTDSLPITLPLHSQVEAMAPMLFIAVASEVMIHRRLGPTTI